jgi:hypothetical protein
MQQPKPVLLICGCERYRVYLEAAVKRMDRPDWDCIGCIGGQTTSFDPATRILTLAVPDTYEALPRKVHAAISWISRERPGISGIFKTDEDIVVSPKALAEAIQTNQARPYWGLEVQFTRAAPIPASRIQARFQNHQLRPSHQAAKYCFGHGYWLSAAAIPTVVAAADEYAKSYLEDVCTGYVMNKAKYMPVCIRIPYVEWPRIPALLSANFDSERERCTPTY